MYYTAPRIFDGNSWRSGTIGTEGGRVKAIAADAPEDNPDVRIYTDACIVPAFVDAQVYGAGGRLFSAYPDTTSLRILAEAAWQGGAALCQPTVATNTLEVVHACIDAVRAYWKEGGEGIGGLHLEGPWISPQRKGAHVEGCIHPPTVAEVQALLEYGRGVIQTITLAPEVCSVEILDLLLQSGIKLSAGHSNATLEEALAAFDRGIPAVTHLYNA
ncbi:MAG: N-acetylglucosamine-6-phosphate deacetylase, partial [Chitinophagaceae bacterium]